MKTTIVVACLVASSVIACSSDPPEEPRGETSSSIKSSCAAKIKGAKPGSKAWDDAFNACFAEAGLRPPKAGSGTSRTDDGDDDGWAADDDEEDDDGSAWGTPEGTSTGNGASCFSKITQNNRAVCSCACGGNERVYGECGASPRTCK